jgi:hypothetical protein
VASKLSEVARHVVIPAGIVTTAWPRVVAQCREMAVEFDSWQQGAGAIMLGKRADGKYAATVGGIVLSIPRQVGKTFLVGMIVIALCVLHPGLTVLWTAHRTRTATKTFGSLKGMTSRKKIAPFMLDPRNTNGEQEIRFKNGSVIMFGARELGFGRGFDEVDVEVFDEAQILGEKALEDMVPATLQSRQEAGALLFFMGTPPRPTDPGEEFTNRRNEALDGKSEDMVYIEFSADPDADPDDWSQVAKANPSFPLRTPRESILRMRKNLTNVDSYKREGLGIWDAGRASTVVTDEMWARVGIENSARAVDDVVFGVSVYEDTEAGTKSAAISVATLDQFGKIHVELVDARPDVLWLVPRLVELKQRRRPRTVVVDSSGPAGALLPDLQAARLPVTLAPAMTMRRACAAFLDGITGRRLAHTGLQPTLSHSVVAGKRHATADGWTWRRNDGSAPLIATTLAHYGWLLKAPSTTDPSRSSQRRAVVL